MRVWKNETMGYRLKRGRVGWTECQEGCTMGLQRWKRVRRVIYWGTEVRDSQSGRKCW